MVSPGVMFATRHGLARLMDLDRIDKAIRAAEARTSGEIRVSVAPLFFGSVWRAAERVFARLGVGNTRERNGVLLFLVPARRRLVVLGDTGIHAKVGQDFWNHLTQELGRRFHAGDFTGGLERAIAEVGERLARDFPCRPDDMDELSNVVDFGGPARPPRPAHP
jgi:uncharacterized membrane protein